MGTGEFIDVLDANTTDSLILPHLAKINGKGITEGEGQLGFDRGFCGGGVFGRGG